jgi:hypothetical protein
VSVKVQVLVEPGGDSNRARLVGEVEIANVTVGGGRMSQDYLWRVRGHMGDGKPIQAQGWLVDSLNESALELLAEVLAEWRSGRPLPIDNHGQATAPEGLSMSPESLWKKLDDFHTERKTRGN